MDPLVDQPGEDAPLAKKEKKVNTKKIGDDAEKRVVAILEAQGYNVCRAWRKYVFIPGRGPMSTVCDFWNCIDILAVKPGERVRAIQVTVDGGIGKKVNDVMSVNWPRDHVSVEIWMQKRIEFMQCREKAAREELPVREVFDRYNHFQVRKLDDGFDIEKATKEQILA